MSRPRSHSNPGALELIERAVHLLRGAPAAAWAAYALGTLPFVLGLLYFWAEMSQGAFARRRCGPESLAMAGLFLWMKCWQSVFCRRLLDHFTGAASAPWGFRRVCNLIVVQGATQPFGLLLLPLAATIIVPLGWTYAFYQNLTALGEGQGEVRPALKKASSLALLWPGNNHLVLLILSLFGLFVWLDVVVGMVAVPQLLKMLLGIETVFSRSGAAAYFNSTFLAATLVTAYYCVDPLSKAIYVLRSFQGASLATGTDLKVELAAFRRAARTAAVAVILLFASTGGARAADPARAAAQAGAAAPSISPPDLNRSIEQVLKRDEFTWRMPREPENLNDAQMNWFARFIRDSANALADGMREAWHAWKKVRDWFEKLWPASKESTTTERGSGVDWANLLRWLMVILIIAISSVIAILIFRLWKQKRPRKVVLAQAMPASPDLADENVVASQLPEDGWLKLARELLDKGDRRLALRAYYLASLAHLAEREMIAIAKFKSNREYETELRRRTRALAELHLAFAENVGIFDRVWYGLHEVTQDALFQFQSNLERIRAC